jgi:hypothetical protein
MPYQGNMVFGTPFRPRLTRSRASQPLSLVYDMREDRGWTKKRFICFTRCTIQDSELLRRLCFSSLKSSLAVQRIDVMFGIYSVS